MAFLANNRRRQEYERYRGLAHSAVQRAAWYEINPAQKQIVIFGEPSNLEISKSRNLEISYHLVAPRHDASEWLNQVETNEKGIPLNIK